MNIVLLSLFISILTILSSSVETKLYSKDLGIEPGLISYPISYTGQNAGDTSLVTLLPIEFAASYNSSKPWSYNQVKVWQGRGLTIASSFGLRIESRFVNFQLNPILFRTSNLELDSPQFQRTTAEQNLFDYYFNRINYRERIGGSVIQQMYWGDTWLKLKLGPLSFGVSNENFSWGPGVRNPLLMSQHAPGFEHLTFYTNRPINIYIGRVQSHMFVGRLSSSYFDDDHLPAGRVHISGLKVDYSPWFAEDLNVGLIRTFTVNEADIGGVTDYVPFFQPFLKYRFQNESNVRGNDRHDQRASAYFNWSFRESRFTIYGEFARDDHSADLRDLFLQPNHTRAFLLGFQKGFDGLQSGSAWQINAEIVQTEYTSTMEVRRAGLLSFYSHGTVRQGYTHKGQMLGSYYGAGGNGWYLSILNQREWGSVGILFERVARNKDLYQKLREINPLARPELEFVVGLSGAYKLSMRNFERIILRVEINMIQYRNKGYLPIETHEGDRLQYYSPRNINVGLSLVVKL